MKAGYHTRSNPSLSRPGPMRFTPKIRAGQPFRDGLLVKKNVRYKPSAPIRDAAASRVGIQLPDFAGVR